MAFFVAASADSHVETLLEMQPGDKVCAYTANVGQSGSAQMFPGLSELSATAATWSSGS